MLYLVAITFVLFLAVICQVASLSYAEEGDISSTQCAIVQLCVSPVYCFTYLYVIGIVGYRRTDFIGAGIDSVYNPITFIVVLCFAFMAFILPLGSVFVAVRDRTMCYACR